MSHRVSRGNSMMKCHLTEIVFRLAYRMDSNRRGSFTFFLISLSVGGEPLSGAYVTLVQPEEAIGSIPSSSIPSERVPLGSCHESFSPRRLISEQKLRIQSFLMIAVRSKKSMLSAR